MVSQETDKRELGGVSIWILNLSRITTGIVYNRNSVEDNDSNPSTEISKNLFWRLNWIEENEDCHSVFVFPTDLNLFWNFWDILSQALFILLIQASFFPLKGKIFLSLTLSFSISCIKIYILFFFFWQHLSWDPTLSLSLLYNSSAHISRLINEKVNFGKIKTRKKIRGSVRVREKNLFYSTTH